MRSAVWGMQSLRLSLTSKGRGQAGSGILENKKSGLEIHMWRYQPQGGMRYQEKNDNRIGPRITSWDPLALRNPEREIGQWGCFPSSSAAA